jgi:polyketide biosynthesis acyl carrier protein
MENKMTREQVFEIVKSKVLEVIVDLSPDQVTPDRTLTELGANSIDRAEVAMCSMEELRLHIPRVQLHGVANIGGLVDVLYRNLPQNGDARA